MISAVKRLPGLAAALALAAVAVWTPAAAQTGSAAPEPAGSASPPSASPPDQTASTQAAAEAGNPVVATVNGTGIRRSEVEQAIGTLPAQLRQMPEEILIPIVAEQLAIGRLVRDQGIAAGLQGDPEVQSRLSEAQDRIIQEVWLERAIRERITDAMLDEAYQAYLAENPVGEEVKARHILVPTEEEARRIIGRLNEGEDFDALVQEFAAGEGNRQGGDLGWFQRQDMVPPFGETAFALQPGEFTQTPVQTQFGWHVILVEDRRTPTPPARDEVREELEQGLRQAIAQQIIAELRQNADIQVFGQDGQPQDGQPQDGQPQDGQPEPQR